MKIGIFFHEAAVTATRMEISSAENVPNEDHWDPHQEGSTT